MKVLYYYQELNKDKSLFNEGLCIFDTEEERIRDYFPLSDYKTMKLVYGEIYNGASESVWSEENHFYDEVANPKYEEDDEGEPVDPDEPQFIEVPKDIYVWRIPQNTIHLLPLGTKVFTDLYNFCFRYRMVRQAKCLEKKADVVNKKIPDAITLDEFRVAIANQTANLRGR